MVRYLTIGIAAVVTAAAVLGRGLTREPGAQVLSGDTAEVQAALVRQTTPRDCGLAAIATLARLQRVAVPAYSSLLARHAPPPGGSTMADLIAIGTSLDLHLDAARVQADGLARIPLPAVVHLRAGHYVVLASRARADWLIADPAQGVRRVPLFVFVRSASGAVLLLRNRKEP